MPRFRWAVIALGVLLCGAAAPSAGNVFPYPIHEATLENGLKVVLVPMPAPGLVAYWTIVRTGARDEVEPGHTGFAHFFEHMMFRGTERYPATVYNRTVTKLGASANGSTTDDFTVYYLTFAASDLQTVADLESDRFQHLAYAEPDFKTESGAVYGEFRKLKTNPFFVAEEALQRTAFTRHTYGHDAIGVEADIQAMPKMYDYSQQFFRRYYRPENVVLLVAGDLQPGPTLELVKKQYAGWSKGYVAPQVPAEPEQTAERRVEVQYEGKSLPIVLVGYKIPAFDAKDRSRVAADALSSLLFGETSELYKTLVLDRRWVELLRADAQWNRDPGLLEVSARLKDPSKVAEVLAEIDRAVAKIQGAPPAAQSLEDLKSNQKYDFVMNLDTPSRVARGLARLIAVTGSTAAIEDYFTTLASVTPADVQAAARTYLRPERRSIVILRGAK